MQKKTLIITIIVFVGLVALCGGPAIIAGAFIWGIVDAAREDATDYPGKKEFKVENAKIDIFSGPTGFGDTPVAVQAATAFSKDMQKIRRQFFKGGSDFNPDTVNMFITYCRITPTQAVVICHVPDVRGYQGEALDALEQTAWVMAQVDVMAVKGDKSGSLIVGLRGFATYTSVQEGKLTGPPTTKDEDLYAERRLYPYFVPAGH